MTATINISNAVNTPIFYSFKRRDLKTWKDAHEWFKLVARENDYELKFLEFIISD